MKKLTLTLCAVALATAAYAGTESYSGKEMKQAVETPCPQWYADNEWNVSIWGTYAPTTNDWEEDTYLGVDHAWGGGVDAKYFFRRYFGLGVQGFGLALDRDDRFGVGFDDDGDDDWAGGLLATFTFRYPIPCTRFAPYGWVGGGGIWGGDNTSFDDLFEDDDDDDGRLMAQYGLGFEVRFTPHVSMINDASWNQVEGGRNDFIMIRSGVNFAF